jgi:cation diffusion facilitator family transporter
LPATTARKRRTALSTSGSSGINPSPFALRRLTGHPDSTQVALVASSTQSPAAGRPQASDARTPAVRRTLVLVLVLNATVAIVKVVVGARTGALTVLGAALESGLDMLNNINGVMLVTVAGRAPDENHPYGHDKFETLGALGVVGFLSISCFELLREGVSALAAHRVPQRVTQDDIALILATLAINAFVVWYERRRGRQLGSAFLMADAAHTSSDILVTLMAVASLALSRVSWPWLDGVLAITVALIIARSGVKILRQSIPILVDERAIDAKRLRSVVLGVSAIRDVRNVRSRSTASGQLFAEVTIAVPGDTPVDEAHRLADAVEAAIEREFGTSQVTVHIEPA